jgi:hypothetical protein
VAVSGSYSDSFALSNAGSLFLGISDNRGTLSATDASGDAVAGSGSNSIALNTDYVDLNAILASLHYTASGSPGSDTIDFDVWNQAGVETTGNSAVTIGSSSISATTRQADSAGTGPMPTRGTLTTDTGGNSANPLIRAIPPDPLGCRCCQAISAPSPPPQPLQCPAHRAIDRGETRSRPAREEPDGRQ